ncbi:MAG: hypothetical protein U0263_38550 [Polyangiaceae bacterium]
MGTKGSTSRKPPFVVTVVTLVGGHAFGCSSDAGGADDPTPAACPAPDAGVDVVLGSPCASGMNCDYPIACHSGPVSLGLVCEGGVWSLRETACPHLADECTPRFRCGPAGWEPPPTLGMNPPAPCPETAPADGAACNPGGGFGLDPTSCGYPCEGASGWMLVSCAQGQTTWKRAACDPSG